MSSCSLVASESSKSSERADLLLVAEHGTRWSRWMSELADGGVSLSVIIQRSRESQASFAQRVRERADALALGRRLPPTILFLASRRVHESIERGRATIARTLVHLLARGPRGRLLLAGGGSASHETIGAMKRVAADVALQLGRTVRVASARGSVPGETPALHSPALQTPPLRSQEPPELPLPAA